MSYIIILIKIALVNNDNNSNNNNDSNKIYSCYDATLLLRTTYIVLETFEIKT
jgi:hypothetical protein